MEKHTNISDPWLRDLVKNIQIPKTEFTQKIKGYYKRFGGNGKYGVQISPQDSIGLFYSLEKYILDRKNTGESRYNAYRIIGLSLTERKIYMSLFGDMMNLIENTYLDTYGNVRTQAYYVLEDFIFHVYGVIEPQYGQKITKIIKNNADIFYRRLIEFYKNVVQTEQQREDEIYEEGDCERKDQRGFMPYSGDTKDTTLKTCRRIIESLDYPYMYKEFKKYGYTMQWSAENNSEVVQEIGALNTKSLEDDLLDFIMYHMLPISVDEIKHLVYQDDGSREALRNYMNFFIGLFEKHNRDFGNDEIQIITQAWNSFPHKYLNGKSPLEMRT